ncbi:ABC transporter permease [Nakamurella leprariae]|uniref:ABC transporter permease n=1 Tax=Nakamurella leprariae TaxID=2803911 RepID=A0A938Y4P5_9ACTN|nr:ABC transporter permease [Nakamurella leprariae]MBM9466006.1 ABC transporter permease [Nakamurella leprariae]
MTATQPARPDGSDGSARRVRRITVARITLALGAVLAFVVCALASPFFLTVDNLANLLDDLALTGIVAVPATFLIMSGHVDLSVGAAAAFSGVVMADLAGDVGLLPAVALAVGTGLVIGLINGLVVTGARIDSVLTTFAAMALLRALAYLVPSGLGIAVAGFRTLGHTSLPFDLSLPIIIFGVLAVVGALLSRFSIGRRTRQIGSLPVAARYDAGPDRRWIIGLFAVSGLAAALVGLIRTSQLGTGLPTASTGLELTVVAAVLLGGERVAGGRGSVIGTVLALVFMAIVDNGLSLANVTAYATQVFHAALLVVALILARPRRRFRRRDPDHDGGRRGVTGAPEPADGRADDRTARGADHRAALRPAEDGPPRP